MKNYLRILRYLGPHSGTFALAFAATFAFAGLDAFAYVLLIPFVSVLFGEGSSGSIPGGGDRFMDRFLDATVYRIVDLQGDRLEAGHLFPRVLAREAGCPAFSGETGEPCACQGTLCQCDGQDCVGMCELHCIVDYA